MNTNRQSKISIFFSNPLVGIIGSIASIVGTVLAIVFYLNGKNERDLTYFVHPVKSTITSINDESGFSIKYKELDIKGDVSTAQIAFWNNGDQSIRRENILKPLRFILEDNSPILEARLRKKSREIVDIHLITENISKGILEVDWNILERNDGGVIQIIYNSNPDIEIIGEAIVEGQNSISKLISNKKILKPGEQYKSNSSGRFILISGLLMIIVTTVVYGWGLRRRRRLKLPLLQKHDIVLAFVIIYAIGIIIYFYAYNGGIIEPPFGF